MRLQTLKLAHAFGAKKKGGGELKAVDMWGLKSDIKEVSPVIDMNADEYRDWYNSIKKKYKFNA